MARASVGAGMTIRAALLLILLAVPAQADIWRDLRPAAVSRHGEIDWTHLRRWCRYRAPHCHFGASRPN